MHDLGSTVRTQASLCGCTSLERANRLMLHFAAYVMHYSRSWAALHRVVQPIHPLRRQGARRCVACLAQIAHRHFLVRAIDPKVWVAAYIDYNMYTTSACVNLMHCSSQAPKHRKMQPVHPPRWQGYTLMRGPLGTTGPQASPCGCTRPEEVNSFHATCSSVCDALPAPGQRCNVWCSLFTLSGGKG